MSTALAVGSSEPAGAPEKESDMISAPDEPHAVLRAPGVEALAEIMFLEFEHCDPTEIENFSDLTEKEREIYRMVIQRLLLSWDLLVRARADLTLPAR